MSDKEKDAIDILTNCIDDYVIGDFCTGKFCPMENECRDSECVFHKSIETVLNLLEKKDKDIRRMQELLDLLDANNVKKDKIIDLMAEQLTTPIHSKEWVKNYYEREIEQ